MPRDLLPCPTGGLNLDLLVSSGAMTGTPRRSLWREVIAFLMAPSPWGGV